MPPALHLTTITKHFGPTAALSNASLTVPPNTIHALLGSNGAGKTTLMHIAFGLTHPDQGAIYVNGTPHTFTSPAQAIDAGIGMVHQHFTLIPAFTVTENIALGGHGTFSRTKTRQRIQALSTQYNLPINPDAPVHTLPVSAQQRVEILKALAHNAKLLILDEPTAVLTPQESQHLLQQLRLFVNQGGTVVLITHKLHDALQYADHITVLRNGQTVLETPTAATTHLALTHAMVGNTTTATFAAESPRLSDHLHQHGHPAITLENVSYINQYGIPSVRAATLTINTHEIVGIAAVEGNGQHELLRILAGRLPIVTGERKIPSYVGFVPEDRHRDALLLESPLTDNVQLANTRQQHGLIDPTTAQHHTQHILNTYDIRASSPHTPARTLSGGNQQKLILGRELEISTKALVVENPTRGLDIHATAAIHHRLRTARDQGLAIALYSSDLDEVLALADRIVVMYDGHLYPVPNTREQIAHAMLGNTARILS